MQRSTRNRLGIATAALTAAVAMVLSGCSSTGSTPASTSSSSGPISLPITPALNLTVGIPSPGGSTADFYWALETGIFTKLGLNVTVKTEGSNEEPDLAAGKMVIGQFGTPGMFAAVQAGRKMSVVYNEISGNNNGNITIGAKNTTVTSLTDLSGATVGVVGANGASYGAAQSYSDYIVKNGGQALKIDVLADIPTEVADIVKGSITAIIGPASLQSAIKAGQVKYLLKAGDPQAVQIMGSQTDSISFHGLASTLAANKEAVTRFVAAMRISLSQLSTVTPTQIAQAMAKNPTFSPTVLNTSDLADSITNGTIPFLAKNDGYVSEDDWNASLKTFSGWGLNVNGTPLNMTAPQFAYGNTVDMSYWNNATAYVNAYNATASPTPAG